jgi:hypothetical protein
MQKKSPPQKKFDMGFIKRKILMPSLNLLKEVQKNQKKVYWTEKFSYRTDSAPPITLAPPHHPHSPSTPFILPLQLGPME